MGTILLNNHGYDNETWRVELEKKFPHLAVRLFGEPVSEQEVVYAMVWNHPPGDLKRYPNLRAVFSLGAGAEHFAADNNLPDVPIVLLADPAVARDMAAHTLYWVMTFHRRYHDYQKQQAQRQWGRKSVRPAGEFRVGVVGLGRIGSEVARRISGFGYSVSGWDRAQRSIDGVECHTGSSELPQFLAQNDVVINCLLLSPETRHMLNREKFALMKDGAYFINISRGAVVLENDLIEALDSGKLAGAALDVFESEPLPVCHPFWSHPQVFVTPHMSGATYASSAVNVIAENVSKLEGGQPVNPVFDRQAGF